MKPATIHKARVEHTCSDCRQPIAVGAQYVKETYPRIHGGSPEFTPPDFYHFPQCRDQQRHGPQQTIHRLEGGADQMTKDATLTCELCGKTGEGIICAYCLHCTDCEPADCENYHGKLEGSSIPKGVSS